MAIDSGPAPSAATITAHATNPINPVPRAIYVGTTGDITGRAKGSTTDVVFKAVPAGSILPVAFQYIRVSGTTAADLVALY